MDSDETLPSQLGSSTDEQESDDIEGSHSFLLGPPILVASYSLASFNSPSGSPPALEAEDQGPPSIETQAEDLDEEEEGEGEGGPPSLEVQAADRSAPEDLESEGEMGVANTWTGVGADNDQEMSFHSPPMLEYPLPLAHSDGGVYDEMPCLESQLVVGGGDSAPFNSPVHEAGELMTKDPLAIKPGVCGIRNLGNTCFMAAGLQCLLSTPSLAEYFLDRPLPPELEEATENLTTQFALLLRRVWSGHFGVLQPNEFKRVLGAIHPQFKDYRQHDCQEFIALLLDTLHEQLNAAGGKKETGGCCSSEGDMGGGGENGDEGLPPLVDEDEEDEKDEGEKMVSGTVQVATLSESSRSSQASSPHSSSDSHASGSNAPYRMHPIPEDMRTSSSCEPASTLMMLGDDSDLDKSPPPPSVGLEKNELLAALGSSASSSNPPAIKGLEDIFKDAKTSNVNVLASPGQEQPANNELVFDSEKFPRLEVARPRDAVENLNLGAFGFVPEEESSGKVEASGTKRIKDTNLVAVAEAERGCNNKRARLMGSEGEGGAVGGEGVMFTEEDAAALKEKVEADRHWAEHVALNKSIVVETFQGQFKSTVVCSACRHVSVTYEPFMYLSVPLPRAMERQLCVTFVPASHRHPVRYLLTMNREDRVRKVQERIAAMVGIGEGSHVVITEVLDNHIAKALNENLSLRHVNDTHRTIYAFEVRPPPPSSSSSSGEISPNASEVSCPPLPPPLPLALPIPLQAPRGCEVSSSTDTIDLAPMDLDGGPIPLGPVGAPLPDSAGVPAADERSDGWKSCAICLEEMADSDLLRHVQCSCLLCENCIDISCKHYSGGGGSSTAGGSSGSGGDRLQCPMCGQVVRAKEDFVKLDRLKHVEPQIRTLHVSVVFRLDTEGDGNNNQKGMKLFGHPSLLCLPSQLPAVTFHQVLRERLPHMESYDVLLVDGQGLHCSRCMYTSHCRGCAVPAVGQVVLQPGDTLAMRFKEMAKLNWEEANGVDHDESMSQLRPNGPLTIYDCLGAFSESETLDEHNPWYCPMCERNQCATKTLTVWRYPDFLIVYLKRFVFHECFSTKLDNKLVFPVSGLDVSSFLSGPTSPVSAPEYDLYACVCHYGGASAGHYTSYAKHPVSSEWHSFNDDVVHPQPPQEDEYSNAYILFYQRAGTKWDVNVPEKLWLPDEPSTSEGGGGGSNNLVLYSLKSNQQPTPNIDHLLQQLEPDEAEKDLWE